MKDKKKLKKILFRTLKIVWALIGILILAITILIYIKMNSGTGLGIVGWVILFSVGIYSLFLYIIITILFLAIWITKRFLKRKISHEQKFSGKVKRRKPEVSS